MWIGVNLIDLKDSENNMIGQWRNMRPQNGIIDLSYNLPREPALGNYTFTVRDKKDTSSTFLVTKYVLPRFAFALNTPHSVPITQKDLNITACATYTHGKPVQGVMNGTICHSGNNDTCKPLRGKTDASGCCTMRTDTESLRMKRSGFSLTIVVEISFTEDGTGVEMRESKQILITNILNSVKFLDSNPTYRAAIPYKGKMLLTSGNGSPMPNEDLCLYVDGVKQDDIYTTDQYGTARFTLDTTSWTNTHIELRGTLDRPQPVANTGEMQPIHQDGRTTVSRFYSPVKSQLTIRRDPSSVLCDANAQLWADFILDPSESSGLTYIYFSVLVVSRGRIIQNSEIKHDLAPNSGSKGFISVPLKFSARLAPAPTLILFFVLPGGDLVADAAKFKISDNCFPNKVSLRFSEEQTLPGSELNLNIRAAPGSLCSVRGIDQSILMLQPDTQNPKDQVNGFLSLLGGEGYPIEVQEYQDCFTVNPIERVALPVMDRRLPVRHFPPLMNAHEMDTFNMFQGVGLKVMCDRKLRKPLECFWRPHPLESVAFASPAMVTRLPESDVAIVDLPIESKSPEPAPEIRQKFPETWLFYLYEVGKSGQADIAVTAPDSITQYVVDSFCTSPVGIGFSPTASVTVFKQFFIEPIVPYSIKQGESFVLKAAIFKFMKQCMKVKATLFKSSDFAMTPCMNCSYESCLCNAPTFTASWVIVPKIIGNIEIIVSAEALTTRELCDGKRTVVPQRGRSDTVLKRLRVEPRGVRIEKTHSSLLCASESEKISLSIPNNVVKGSESAVASVIGDALGMCLANLGDLLRMPYGCGEQNMINFVPNIAIVNYLKAIGKLTPEILLKVKHFLQTGYQQQLTFKHSDGSYSAFGNSDPSGNTWLTAFVATWFSLCNGTIYIDNKHITDALNWLKDLQQEDGCFKNVGKLFHKDLQGGVNDDTTLTAYVTAAYLQIDNPNYNSVIEKAFVCLEKSLAPGTNVYTKAICAFVYTLGNKEDKRQILLGQLDGLARTSGNGKYWSVNPVVPSEDLMWPNPESANIEVTAYVLIALILKPNPSSADLAAARPVARWLMSQQNPQGGFCSTQDTAIALQALAQYERLTFNVNSQVFVTITNSNAFSHSVVVSYGNRLLVQQKDLPDIPGEYTVSVSGSGCALVQIVNRFNIPEPKAQGAFHLNVQTTAINCPPHPRPRFEITFTFYNIGKNKVSNMAVVKVNMVSGYIADVDSVNNLLAHDIVRKTEIHESYIDIYINEVSPSPVTLSFLVEQKCLVMNLQPAHINLYDYYNPKDRIEGSYSAPCK